MSKEDGGQAFPVPKDVLIIGNKVFDGMTLKEYFMAHAPRVPGWFKPKMEKECPQVIYSEETNYSWEDDRKVSNRKELDEYDLEYKKQTFFQWRTYYADSMIKEKGKR